MKYPYILFDFDGTLSESGPGIIKAMKYGLTAVNIHENNENTLRSFIGPPLNVQLQKIYHLSTDETLAVITKFREQYDNQGVYDATLYDGIEHLIHTLHDKGHILCVASSKPYPLVHKLLDTFHLSAYFAVKIGSDPEDEMKNKAVFDQKSLIIKKTFQTLQDKGYIQTTDDTFLHSAVMIGDKNYDIKGAKSNGITAVGVTWGYGDEAELTTAGADYLCRTTKELETFLLNA